MFLNLTEISSMLRYFYVHQVNIMFICDVLYVSLLISLGYIPKGKIWGMMRGCRYLLFSRKNISIYYFYHNSVMVPCFYNYFPKVCQTNKREKFLS